MHFSAIWMALSGRPPYRYSLPIMYRVREPHGTGFSGSLATASSQRRKELEKAARRSWAWYKSKGMASTHAAIAPRSEHALSGATTALSDQEKSATACPKTPSIWLATAPKSGSYARPISHVLNSVTKIAAGAQASK